MGQVLFRCWVNVYLFLCYLLYLLFETNYDSPEVEFLHEERLIPAYETQTPLAEMMFTTYIESKAWLLQFLAVYWSTPRCHQNSSSCLIPPGQICLANLSTCDSLPFLGASGSCASYEGLACLPSHL
jgi:hypothetical protein